MWTLRSANVLQFKCTLCHAHRSTDPNLGFVLNSARVGSFVLLMPKKAHTPQYNPTNQQPATSINQNNYTIAYQCVLQFRVSPACFRRCRSNLVSTSAPIRCSCLCPGADQRIGSLPVKSSNNSKRGRRYWDLSSPCQKTPKTTANPNTTHISYKYQKQQPTTNIVGKFEAKLRETRFRMKTHTGGVC